MREEGKLRLEDRDVDLKKPWTVDSGPVQEMSFLDVTMRMNTHDMVTGDNDYPSALNQLIRDHNEFLDTTLAATEQTPQVAVKDPINGLADVLTNLQNCPTAQQQFTIRPVNSYTMIFDGKSKKFELFEGEKFHTMIEMQPEMSEQMKINHFH